MKRLIAFDLDGTLADSKQPLSREIGSLLAQLLQVVDVAIISGGDWPQFDKQIVRRLPLSADRERLWLMPTTGAKLYRFSNGQWRLVYADLFGDADKAKIRAAFERAMRVGGLATERTWGEQLQDRGSQFTFSGLGQDAPLHAKLAWDPDRQKRTALQNALRDDLPGFSIALGGTTSIDVTKAGVDKASAIERLRAESGIRIADMLFIGDALYPGGNDEPARMTGIDAVQVRDPAETATVITLIRACLRGSRSDG